MYCTKSLLRAVLNRETQFDGEYTVTDNGTNVEFETCEIRAVSGEDVISPVNDGDSVIVQSLSGIHCKKKVVHVKFHPAFYDNGFVSGSTILTPSEGRVYPLLRLDCTEDGFDISALPYFCKLLFTQ